MAGKPQQLIEQTAVRKTENISPISLSSTIEFARHLCMLRGAGVHAARGQSAARFLPAGSKGGTADLYFIYGFREQFEFP